MRLKLRVSGIVQGVGFRPFVYRIAVKNDLTGNIRNRGDAGVEILIEGKKEKLREFMIDLKNRKPPLAQIYEIVTLYSEEKSKSQNEGFTISRSSKGAELSGSIIPPDIATCDDCLRELRDPSDPRFDYFFITCTNCGPRYTIIDRLPYDRENTTMKEFSMCSFCKDDYTDPLNRRFHAQTVACPKGGPKAYLTNKKGELLEDVDPIRKVGKLLSEGHIVAIKGHGGFHIAATTTKDKPLVRLRRVKHRKQKPFAIMARSLETVESFAEVNMKERELLTSYMRPITLLNKREDYYLSDLIAPDLHNIGVMLPYTGLHYMLFDGVDEPAFVMTSGNPPNQPIVKDNEEALEKLSGTVEYFLFHDRDIAQRCDDSVARVHNNRYVCLIRRSRGYAPAPVHLKTSSPRRTLGLGGELNVVSCVLHSDRAFLSQHVGNVENIETLSFLEAATKHLIRLTNTRPEVVACDLHPRFNTTKLAHKLSDEFDCPMVQVQHHYAHIAALMAEHNSEEIIGIACDGYGYGPKGEAWGGEILYCNQKGYKRVGHLEEQPMLGGDLATHYPLRMATGILHKVADISEWLLSRSEYLPHGREEAELILTQLNKNVKLKTSSCGRVLDAISAMLGICYERTYEGEPAIKLEAAATNRKNKLNLTPRIENNTINTTDMVSSIFEEIEKRRIGDLAFSAQEYIAKSLAELAVQKAQELGVKRIGFSGGVAYNRQISATIHKTVEERGMEFAFHKNVPAGDGGTSFGQAIVAGLTDL